MGTHCISALILIIISVIILYEAISIFINPAKIIYLHALPVSFVGLVVNVASGFILSCRCKASNTTEEIIMAMKIMIMIWVMVILWTCKQMNITLLRRG